ncbi:MAG TPA: biopolymer transporter ExbD [Deltaproteobacteria bacterium]|nr:biopolymer transporter ExbD [Deltaproteobacteria bacterium]
MLPLIDVVFLLLVFFIYAMLSMAVHRGGRVELPASRAAAVETGEAVAVTIRREGEAVELLVDGEAVPRDGFVGLLRERAGGSADRKVRVFADRSVSYEQLFSVLDMVKEAGLSRISLQAGPRRGAR